MAEEIIFRPILESASRVAALQSGEIDVCIDPPINDLQFLEEDENVVVHNQAGTRLFYFGFNCEHEPFDNQTLRQAISCAIDKQTIVDVVLQGYGQTQKTVVNRGVWSFYDDMEGYEYDVERAKELMAEAGYPDGLDEPVTLYAANSSPYSTIAPMIQQYLSVIGIEVEIVTRDEATLKPTARPVSTTCSCGAGTSSTAWMRSTPSCSPPTTPPTTTTTAIPGWMTCASRSSPRRTATPVSSCPLRCRSIWSRPAPRCLCTWPTWSSPTVRA